MDLTIASVTHAGRRTYNQDMLLVEQIPTAAGRLRLLAVFDGMGGMRAGDRASELASEVFLEQLRVKLPTLEPEEFVIRKALAEAAIKAHHAVFEEGRNEPAKRGMGTTLVALLEKDGEFIVANVGDSRAYLWSPENKTLTQLTRDHSLREEAVRMGTLTREEAEKSPIAHALTRSIGSGAPPNVDLFPEPEGWLTMPPGGAVVLCSDGLNDGLEDDEIRDTLAGCSDATTAADYLLRAAYHGGSRDNISAIVFAHPEYQAVDSPTKAPPPMDEDEPATDPGLLITPKQPPAKPKDHYSWLILLLALALLIVIFVAIWRASQPVHIAPPVVNQQQVQPVPQPTPIATPAPLATPEAGKPETMPVDPDAATPLEPTQPATTPPAPSSPE